MMEMLRDYLPQIIGVLSTAVAGVIGYFANKKKNQLELDRVRSQNIESNLKLYQSLLNDLEDRYDKRIEALEEDLKNERKKYAQLRREFEEYKEKHP